MFYITIHTATLEELERAGLGATYVEHGKGIYPMDANGVPFTAASLKRLK